MKPRLVDSFVKVTIYQTGFYIINFMEKELNLIGKKFGRWIVINFAYKRKGYPYWQCKCECGTTRAILLYGLLNGRSKSCGCLKRDKLRKKHFIHGFVGTKFYRIWNGIKRRTLDNNSIVYKNYGGRGIKVCDRWLKFKNFRDDMYESYLVHVQKFGEKDTSIDRIDNNGDYCKENCRWATWKEQSINKRNNHLIVYKNKTLTLSQWSKIYNMKFNTLLNRINRGWPIQQVFTSPPTGSIQTSNHLVTYNNLTLPLKQWSRKLNIGYKSLFYRISVSKWSIEKAFTTPIRKGNYKSKKNITLK